MKTKIFLSEPVRLQKRINAILTELKDINQRIHEINALALNSIDWIDDEGAVIFFSNKTLDYLQLSNCAFADRQYTIKKKKAFSEKQYTKKIN